MLRAESANQDVSRTIEGALPPPPGPPRYLDAYEKLKSWIDDTLDVYKPELRRLLWPIFVHCYLNLVAQMYPNISRQFFEANS